MADISREYKESLRYDDVIGLSNSKEVNFLDIAKPSFRPKRTVFILLSFEFMSPGDYVERQDSLIHRLYIFYKAYGVRANLKFIRINPRHYRAVPRRKRVYKFSQLLASADMVVVDSEADLAKNYDIRILWMYADKLGIPCVKLSPYQYILEGWLPDFDNLSFDDSSRDDSSIQEYIIDTKEATIEELQNYVQEIQEEW